jgi:hypothetical protein
MMKDLHWVRAWPNVGLLDSGEVSLEKNSNNEGRFLDFISVCVP